MPIMIGTTTFPTSDGQRGYVPLIHNASSNVHDGSPDKNKYTCLSSKMSELHWKYMTAAKV